MNDVFGKKWEGIIRSKLREMFGQIFDEVLEGIFERIIRIDSKKSDTGILVIFLEISFGRTVS